MAELITAIIGGAALGGTYALISLGLVLAFRATSTLNFAQGEFMVLPAYVVARLATTHSSDIGLDLVIGVAVGVALSSAFYLVVLRKLAGRPLIVPLVASFAFAGILDAVLELFMGPNIYNISLGFLPGGITTIAGARFSDATLVITAFTLLLGTAMVIVVRTTELGLRLRAAGQDAVLASQGQINSARYYLVSWGVAGALAAIAGVAYGAEYGLSSSTSTVAIAAFPAILLGGLDSIEGALIGGVIIGVIEGFVTTYVSGDAVNVVVYTLLLVVLLVRPQGIFGTRAVIRS